jgi:hypothetical protein
MYCWIVEAEVVAKRKRAKTKLERKQVELKALTLDPKRDKDDPPH